MVTDELGPEFLSANILEPQSCYLDHKLELSQ
jgi:hypothetical protein